jgi:hypothetical protein
MRKCYRFWSDLKNYKYCNKLFSIVIKFGIKINFRFFHPNFLFNLNLKLIYIKITLMWPKVNSESVMKISKKKIDGK